MINRIKTLSLLKRIKARSKNLFFSFTDKTNTTQYLPFLITNLYGNPSRKIKLIGITGTNGKSTTTYLIHQALQKLGFKAGLIGTINVLIGDQSFDTKLTTPKPSDLSRILKKMIKNNCQYCFMEVSSIGLLEHRVNGLRFSAGVFTNLTHDHMDYHKSMDNYRDAKSLLFQKLTNKDTAVLNRDDSNWEYFYRSTNAKTVTYGQKDRGTVNEVPLDGLRTIYFHIHKSDLTGTVINLDGYTAKFKLLGKFNAYNLAAAYTTLISFGFNKKQVHKALTKATPPPGRLQVINPEDTGINPIIIIDYAHTPDALVNVLITLRGIVKGNSRLITLFGCGGDRDNLKRAEMGKVASQYSDKVIITSDNPRSEDPEAIIKDILKGINKSLPVHTETSRKEAIHKAIHDSSRNDVILIAGKGHETYQEIKGVKNKFDDREIALEALNLYFKNDTLL